MMQLNRTGRAPVLIVLGVLLTWLVIWLGALTVATREQRIFWLALGLIPLMLVAVAVWRNTKAGYTWCGFVSLGYLAQGITVAWTSTAQAYAGAVEIFLSIVLFAVASGALRARRQTS